MDDIIDVIQYDAKHSFEDTILPVEQAYEKWKGRIAVLGGMDLDYIIRSNPEDVFKRALEMLQRTEQRGGYALGSGNSIPKYVPDESYLAMISAVFCYS
jgi:uroporphyrinogen decarboxylase